MQKISFPYRSASHLPFLRVVRDCGAWRKYGLDVDVEHHIGSTEAHRAVKAGKVDFVGGNHVTPYAQRLHGDKWCYIGQCINSWNSKIVVRKDSKLHSINDLKGKRIAIKGAHPSLNAWLLLKRNGIDADAGQADLVEEKGSRTNWGAVADGDADAAFVSSPTDIVAKRAGLKILEAPKLPMIFFTTVSTSLSYTLENPEVCLNFLRGLSTGIRFFQARKEESIGIMMKTSSDVDISDRETAESFYSWLSSTISPRMYPTLDAIQAVYEISVREHPDAAKVNPMELWDMHFLRQLDDAGELG